jgi:hypothetical protein
MTSVISGRTYAEVGGSVNTGIAFANPNNSSATISFNFTDQNGFDFGQSSFVLDANTQTAKFLNEAPFNAVPFTGTFTFTAAVPVGVIALRTLVNERAEFLATTQTITPLQNNFSPVLLGHFADGGGWRTELILVNTSDSSITGTVQFLDEGSSTTAGAPVTLNVNGLTAASFPYSIRPRTSVKLATLGAVTAVTRVGSVQVTPDAGSVAPAASAFVALSSNGVTVAQAAIQAQPSGFVFRSYVEVTSNAAIPGATQTAVAIANNSVTPATVNFELTFLNGVKTGVTASLVVPASGHASKFVHELFPGLTLPFHGILRVSSRNSIVVVSMRARYNERGDFLVTTTPAANEALPSTIAEFIFPHIVDQGGYSSQFILFSTTLGQSTTGTMQFFGQGGSPLNLTVAPSISSINSNPNPPLSSQAFTLTLTGTGFDAANSTVSFSGPGCTATLCSITATGSSTLVTGQAILAAGTFTVTLKNNTTGLTSRGVSLMVTR